jgi:hypothetical protein
MEQERKIAKVCGLLCTIAYLALFFLSFYVIVFLPSLYGNPEMTGKIGLLLVFLSLLEPLSIVVSIALIWNRYNAEDYRSLYIACLIPVATLIILVILMKLIEVIYL